MSTMTDRFLAEHRCAQTKHPPAHVARFRMSNGVLHYCVWCPECRCNVTPIKSKKSKLYISKAEAAAWATKRGIDLESLPIVSNESLARICYTCGRVIPCEDHHVAERAVYGELADQLPVVPLCLDCHDKVTRRFNAAWQGRLAL